MTKKLEDYELTPESEGSDKNKTIWAKLRARWEKANEKLFEENPEDAKQQLEHYMENKRRVALKKTDDRKEGIAAFNEKRKPNFKGQ